MAAAGATAAAARVAGGPRIADRAWFNRPAAEIAADLLGCLLVHDAPEGRVAGRLVEVEAYQGPEDLAAHSSRGRTPRNAVMFGPPGHLYVYLVYGLHHCANIVCGPDGKPEAVLLRAAEITDGLELARARRGAGVPTRRLASGPGNLGAAFGLDRTHDGADLVSGPIWLAPGRAPLGLERRPRIGVDYAGAWATRPLRFVIPDDPHLSRR
jgi:DNA-3-methyladenine glycosylase